MSLIKNVFIFLIILLMLFLILNFFFIRSNILWDNIISADTSNEGGNGNVPTLSKSRSSILQGAFSRLVSRTTEDVFRGESPEFPGGSQDTVDLQTFGNNSMNSNLVIPNSTFPNMMGSNFMFSIWFFIDDYTQGINNNKFISTLIGSSGGNYQPTLITFLTPFKNNLGIAITTQTSSEASRLSFYFIENIPLQRWNCLILSVVNRNMDVYLDGKLVNSFILGGFYVPLPDTQLVVGNSGENFFRGFITRARFANGGVNPREAFNIYREGINTSFLGDFLNRYRLKIGLYKYDEQIGGFSI